MKGNKLFVYFLSGSFIVAALIIFLYRAIKTDIQIYAFMFLSMLIVMIFCLFLLELMFFGPLTDEIIDVEQDSRLLSNILFLSLFLTILVIVPLQVKAYFQSENETKPNNCSRVLNSIQSSPDSIYDTKLLKKCPYTEPLTKIIPANDKEIDKSAQNLLPVIGEYIDLFTQNLSFLFSILLTIFSGVSYGAFVTLFFKKLVLLIISIFNSIAIKEYLSPDE